MKLIEADKVEQAIKDYWKAQVDRAPIPKSTEEYNAYVNCLGAILERNDGLLKAIDELPSAEPDTTTHDSIPAETGENDGDRTSGDCISRRVSLEKIRTLQTYKLFAGDDMILIDKAQVQTELMGLPSIQPEIIRCKDCKHWNPQLKTANGNGLGSCDFHNVALVTSEGFCYWAEKREVSRNDSETD